MKIILTSFIVLVILLFSANTVLAYSHVAGSSAQLKKNQISNDSDFRVLVLRSYLLEHNSPLADHAQDFIDNADKYNLDWRLVPAITGVESTFGKRIPANSYNAYGWANGVYHFDSWEDSIHIVSKTLREKYIDNGADTMPKIARRYAASPNWEWKVEFFRKKINPLPLTFTI